MGGAGYALLPWCVNLNIYYLVLWGIGIAYDNARRMNKEVWPYITVEVIVGLILPFLTILATVIFSIFLEYITQATVDARLAIPHLFPIVKLVKGEKPNEGIINEYWTISKRFYLQLDPHDVYLRSKDNNNDTTKDSRDKDETANCLHFLSRTPATWMLTIIVALSFLLATSYFMNTNIVSQSNLKRCPHESRIETDCFNQGDFSYVNCSDPQVANSTNFTLLHCFKFLRFGQDSDVIGSLSRSFAFYLTTIAFFTTAFHIVNILINFRPSKHWGILFIVPGVLVLGAFLTIIFTNNFIVLKLNVIQIVQLLMVAVFVILVGVLLYLGKWWECVAEDGKNKALEAEGAPKQTKAEAKEELKAQSHTKESTL